MAIIQVSTILEDRPGELARISEALGREGINMTGLMVATRFGGGRGLLRFICAEPDRAVKVLSALGFEVETNEILAVQTPHHPGGLTAILNPLRDADINVHHLYPCIGTLSDGQTVLLLGVDDVAAARQALRSNWIIMVGQEIYDIES